MSANSREMDSNNFVLPEMLQYVHSDVFSKLDIGILCLDKNDKVLYSNEVFQFLTGTNDADVIGNNLNHLSSTIMKNYSSLFDCILSAKKLEDFNKKDPVKIVTHDGCLKYFTCDIIPSFENEGRFNGMMCLLKDETVKTVCSNKSFFGRDGLDVSHLPFVSFLWKGDDSWSVEYVSDNVVQFGYGPDDFKSGKLSYVDIVHPDYLGSVRSAIDQCAGNNFSKEYMLLTANGESRWVLEKSYAIRDKYKNITHFHGIILDIDERKRFEQELKSTNLQQSSLSELGEKALSCSDINDLMNYTVELIANTLDVKYGTIMEKLSDGRFLLRYGYGWSDWGIGSVVVDKNEGSQAGYTVFTGKPVIIDDLSSEIRFKVPRFLHEQEVVSGASVIIGSKNEPFGILCVHTDIKKKFSEHEINFLQSVSSILADTIRLRESFSSLELYKKLMNQSTDYIMVLDAVSKKFIYLSDRIFQSLGYSESEIMAQNIFEPDCFIKGLNMHDVTSKVVDKGSLLLESEFMRKNGTSFPVDISFAFVENEDSTYMVLIGRDISERRAFEKAIKEHSNQLEYSNELKDMFADVTSHDLTSSVSIIEGFVEYLSEIEDDDGKKHLLGNINKATEKLKKTIEYASVFAKMNCSTDMVTQKLDLRWFFSNSMARLHDKVMASNIEVVLNSPESCPARVNPILDEVFFNLMSNAIKYSPEGSEVIVDITEAGNKWKVSVSDVGQGISDEDKLSIFGRFKRAGSSSIQGKGLGLSIAKMALKCHGEELHVIDNKVGKGSTFWFTVKVYD
ncbi:PAS domain S-box protein [Methanolobus sp. ZRKC5]|uniref:PAS domain S-box protein n=1 Tax=unclassified Methanolobus TaxID=2629569 RepID=UPI00313DE3E2